MFVDRVLSGMRPTGSLHLAIIMACWKTGPLQSEYECLFFAADWHALTTTTTTRRSSRKCSDMIIDWFAGRRSIAGHFVHPVAGTRARRAASVAVDDDAAWLA